MTTIIIAHVTLTMAFVTVIVQSRLSQMDESIEEAALDLGARPWKVFFLITLPIIFPAILAGWLLAFLPWVLRSLSIYLHPRADGRPG
jgi:putrescine transport system permease protein